MALLTWLCLAVLYAAVHGQYIFDAVNSINGMILTYGQTGAGKTYNLEHRWRTGHPWIVIEDKSRQDSQQVASWKPRPRQFCKLYFDRASIYRETNDLVEDLAVLEPDKSLANGLFHDKSLANGLLFLELLSSVEPRVVNWYIVTKGENEEEKRFNATYKISVARKLGCSVFLLPEDIVEVDSKMILTLIGSIMLRSPTKQTTEDTSTGISDDDSTSEASLPQDSCKCCLGDYQRQCKMSPYKL